MQCKKCMTQVIFLFNSLLPNVPCESRLAKISISIQEGIIGEISFERPDYESVYEKILS